MTSNYNRSLNSNFIYDLKEGLLKPLLQRVKEDDTLMLALRGRYINIYYRGGALLKVEQNSQQYVVSFDHNYEKSTAQIPDYPTRITDDEDVDELLSCIGSLKEIMNRYFTGNKKLEREYQQLVVRENNQSSISNETEYFIVDIEAAGMTEAGNKSDARFDMLAVRWLTNERQKSALVPVLIEMKYGTGALKGTAGIIKHQKDAEKLLGNTALWNKVVDDLEIQINQLDDLGLLTYNRSTRVEKLSINRQEKPELIFLLANYNPRSTEIKAVLEDLSAANNPTTYELLFATSSFMGYGLHSANMLNLEDFKIITARDKYQHKI
ncbi:MAG: hypothetical protein IBX50_18995 [Marinospirillum sp.]|uniref:hypothetical protein n=1 Tax=Marinospirillum sp. TaxID=2183934 RepID=UPI0019F931D8|nr:hypothetical protein [Marinospirillum sp.]MBE0508777.1 hypothetical protein [Marinospirillum sp.]